MFPVLQDPKFPSRLTVVKNHWAVLYSNRGGKIVLDGVAVWISTSVTNVDGAQVSSM